jgi:hypothetical protein
VAVDLASGRERQVIDRAWRYSYRSNRRYIVRVVRGTRAWDSDLPCLTAYLASAHGKWATGVIGGQGRG